MSPFCTNCGFNADDLVRFCPNCGHQVNTGPPSNVSTPTYHEIPQSTQSYPRHRPQGYSGYYKPNKKNTNGGISLACSLIGLFTPIIVAWLFVLLAIGFGINGRNKDSSPGLANAGLILGLLGLCCCALLLLLPFPYYFF